MSQERISELHLLLQSLERKIRPLEWDLQRNQINDFRKQQLGRFQQERVTLRQQLDELRQSIPPS